MAISRERVQFVFKKVELDLSKLASKPQPENVHSFRTNTRRLQTLLEELVPGRDHNRKKLLKLLDGIRKRAGKVRNYDVQIGALRSLKVVQEPRRKTQLMHELLELRAKHERKLRKALTKQTIREIEKRLKRTRDTKFKDECDPLAIAQKMLMEAVGSAGAMNGVLPKKSKGSPSRSLSAEKLHECRIAIKRARYVAEFAAKTEEARQFILLLKHIQDAIGNWHDWQTLTNSAQGRLGDVSQSSLVAALHNVTGGKLRGAIAAVSNSAAMHAPKTTTLSPSRPRKTSVKTPPADAPTHSAA